MRPVEIALFIGLAVLILLAVLLLLRIHALRRDQTGLPALLIQDMEARHRAVLTDLHTGLAQQSDRIQGQLAALQIAQTERLAETRATVTGQFGQFQSAMLEKLIEQGRAEQSMLQDTLKGMTAQFGERVQQLSQTVDGRLNEISGKVAERLDEGFKKTNETFTSVMSRLAVIDEAQKKIEDLASNVVSLQEILGDKRSRGAFGEVQLEALVRNSLPPDAYAFQHTLKSGARADCVLVLPEPTGTVCVDSKFPLENYSRMFDDSLPLTERDAARRQFKSDVRKHVDDIAAKYIVEGETSDGAVMFLPAEAVFAEIHAYHPDLVEHAQKKRVWLTSPTTLMAVLNTARGDPRFGDATHGARDQGRTRQAGEGFRALRRAHEKTRHPHRAGQQGCRRSAHLQRQDQPPLPADRAGRTRTSARVEHAPARRRRVSTQA
jgi:DNA recombination protein RmuC